MSQINDYQRHFICTICSENLKNNWGYQRFKKEFPKFMDQISQKQFNRVVSNFNQKGIMKRAKGSGRPSISNEINNRVMKGLQTPPNSQNLSHMSQREVALDLGISQSSVSRIAKRRKLKCFKRVRVQMLTDRHRRNRLQLTTNLYSRFHLGHARHSWKDIWFSDEASISLMQPLNRQNCRIYRAVEIKRQISDEELLVQQDRQGPSVMVYAAVSWHGKTDLFFSDGRINQHTYRTMLSGNIFPQVMQRMAGARWIWQQDGATAHTATSVQEWLANECPDWIKKSEWPAKSPDLNPLDYGIWGILTEKVAGCRQELQIFEDLKQLFTREWCHISLQQVRKISGSWGKRLLAVQAADCGHIEHIL